MKRIPTVLLALAVCGSAFAAPLLRDARSPAGIPTVPEKGRLLVVNVWATWCVPCVHEIAALRSLHAAYRGRGVEMLGISLDDVLPGEREKTRAKVARFLTEKRVAYPNVYYLGRQEALADALRFEGEIPITIVFDARGREVFRVQGVVEREPFARKLDQLLGAGGSRR